LVPRPVEEGPKQNKKKWQIEAKLTWHMFWRENQLAWTQKKKKAKKESC
jgi:hypothetical protein